MKSLSASGMPLRFGAMSPFTTDIRSSGGRTLDEPVRVRARLRRGGSRKHVRVAAKKPPSLSSALERVGRGERVVLRRGKKPVAAVVPIKDLRLLEEIEDRRDAELARKALAEPGRVGYGEVLPKP